MADLPPPTPENVMQPQQLPAAIELPVTAVKTLARYYCQFSWLIPMIARATGQKVPPELDQALKAIANSDDPNAMQNLQRMAQGQNDPYNIQAQEIPEPRIGERVLTQDLAQRAWDLYHKQGLSLREIAAYFTNELGAPCSHATIASYIQAIDEDLNEHRHDTLKTAAKFGALIVAPAIMVFVVEHFLKW